MRIWDSNQDGPESQNVNMFGDCEKTLELMADERVFDITYYKDDGKFGMREMCDEWFGMTLTAEMCEDLSELFSKIAEKIKE